MKLVIISRDPKDYHVQKLQASAKKHGFSTKIVNLNPRKDLNSQLKFNNSAVVWRSSSLDIRSEKAAAARLIEQDNHLLNRISLNNPYTSYKYYQQSVIAENMPEYAIPTVRPRSLSDLEDAINRGVVNFPIIAKPNYGTKGKNIVLLESKTDLSKFDKKYKDYIFQTYIPNKGDWRVLVLNGSVLGVMHRSAKPGSIVNNISQGGMAAAESNTAILEQLKATSLRATAVFGLEFASIDIIQDEHTKQYYILEIGTTADWQEFQNVTGIDVAANICSYLKNAQTRHKETYIAVKDTFDQAFKTNQNKAFHYYSRMYLWGRDIQYHHRLLELREEYIGLSAKESAGKLQKIFETNSKTRGKKTKNAEARAPYFAKYPQLTAYTGILFKVLFCETIYQQDLREQAKKFIDEKYMVELYNVLLEDKDALMILSTHAINFLYLARFYSKHNVKLSKQLPDPLPALTEIADSYAANKSRLGIDQATADQLQLYFVTHIIIGLSEFYNVGVNDLRCSALLKVAERTIYKSWASVSLDNKYEFLVAASLCGYNSRLFDPILQDSSNYFSRIGNYLIDPMTSEHYAYSKDNIFKSEHRNVLFLMASTSFAARPKTRKSSKQLDQTDIIGRKAMLDFQQLGLSGVEARVDSGADYSALHCQDVVEEVDQQGKNYIKYWPLVEKHPSASTEKPATSYDYETVRVRNTSGVLETRYVVYLEVAVNGKTFVTPFTLSNRSNMIFPALLGRRALAGRFLVDTAKLLVK